MNTRELRIGNYVDVKDVGIVKVNGVTQHKIGWCPAPGRERYARAREVEPVELSSEVMKSVSLPTEIFGKIETIEQDELFHKFKVIIDNKFVIRYLHDFQNVIFLLTGKELSVNFKK